MSDKEKSMNTELETFPKPQSAVEDIEQENKSDNTATAVESALSYKNEINDQGEYTTDTSDFQINPKKVIAILAFMLFAISVIVLYIYVLVRAQQADDFLRHCGFNPDVLLSGDTKYLVCIFVILIGIIYLGSLLKKAFKIKLEMIYCDALQTTQVCTMSDSDKNKFELNFKEFSEACNHAIKDFTGLIFCIMLFASNIALPMFSESIMFRVSPRVLSIPSVNLIFFLFYFLINACHAVSLYRNELKNILKRRHKY